MVETIPTVSRARGDNRWISTALAYLLGSTAAAIPFGAAIALLGQPVATHLDQRAAEGIGGIAALAWGLAEWGWLRLPRPQRHEQVPAGWRALLAPEVTGGLYGAMLGIGVLTRIAFASFYVLVAWTLLSGTIAGGALIFGAFAIARALPATLLSPFLRHDEVAFQLAQRLMPLQRPLMRLTGLVLVVMAALSFAHVLY